VDLEVPSMLFPDFLADYSDRKNKILGNEFAGGIEAIGKNVTLFNIGDKVLGYNDKTFGSHAEFYFIFHYELNQFN
jgi:NADPH:quinone reductase-like Zn-dependent oxidoreductase